MAPLIERAKDDVILLGARVARLQRELRQARLELERAIAALEAVHAASLRKRP